jgi:class 3 adenylate cyclase
MASMEFPDTTWVKSYTTDVAAVIGHIGEIWRLSEEPHVIDCHIIALSVDVRGFTKYCRSLQSNGQDLKVRTFLRKYFEIFPRAFLQLYTGLWYTNHVISGNPSFAEFTLKADDMRRFRPKSFKLLGDGIFLVWEATETAMPQMVIDCYKLTRHVAQIFEQTFRQGSNWNHFGQEVSDLSLGFGLAAGHSWKMEYSGGGQPEYSGDIMNLAAKLQGLAKPDGLLASVDSCPKSWVELSEHDRGTIENIQVAGFEGELRVFKSSVAQLIV